MVLRQSTAFDKVSGGSNNLFESTSKSNLDLEFEE